MPPRRRPPTARFVALMNERYERIRGAAWGEASLDLSYDGETWTAGIEVRPGTGRMGEGVTMELALGELEEAMGLPAWTG